MAERENGKKDGRARREARAAREAVLARNGYGPSDDPTTLHGALTVRGWEARVRERAATEGKPPRHVAVATRRGGGDERLRAAGPSPSAALAQVLAEVLAREG